MSHIIRHAHTGQYFVGSGYAVKSNGVWRPMGNYQADMLRATRYTEEEMEFFTSPIGGQWVEETDALAAELQEEDQEDCDCADRSWYGSEHDTVCPLTGPRA